VSRALVADHSKARPPNPGRDLGCRMRSTAAFVRANKCRPALRLPSSIDRPRTPCGREWRQENLSALSHRGVPHAVRWSVLAGPGERGQNNQPPHGTGTALVSLHCRIPDVRFVSLLHSRQRWRSGWGLRPFVWSAVCSTVGKVFVKTVTSMPRSHAGRRSSASRHESRLCWVRGTCRKGGASEAGEVPGLGRLGGAARPSTGRMAGGPRAAYAAPAAVPKRTRDAARGRLLVHIRTYLYKTL
jgi:hypothetical protein